MDDMTLYQITKPNLHFYAGEIHTKVRSGRQI